MSLKKYLGESSIELLKCKVESSTGIQLKSFPQWLINEDQLRKQQEIGKRGSAIVITIKEEAEAKKQYTLDLQFGGAVKMLEKY